MLLRTCPRCGDFFAGDAPPFCPADGTPLADVDPRGDRLAEGARVVEEKTRLVRRRVRRLKLRRVLTTMMTVVVTMMIVFVVVANYVVYLKPDPEAPRLLAAVLPSPSPTSPTPVPVPTPSPTITPSPTPTPVCTDEDRRAAEKLILSSKNRDRWDKAIATDSAERERILAQYAPFEGMANPGMPTYGVTFTKDCQTATVTAHYIWRVASPADIVRKEGSREVEVKWREVKAKRTFRCSKDGAAWRCP